MKKQLAPFIFHLPNNLQLEINAKVDTRTEQEVYDKVTVILTGVIRLGQRIEQPSNKVIDIHFPISGILREEMLEDTNALLKDYPVKIYYLPNNENIYIEYDKHKSVEIQTVFYEQFNVKELLLNCPELIQKINTQAIAESIKPEIINI